MARVRRRCRRNRRPRPRPLCAPSINPGRSASTGLFPSAASISHGSGCGSCGPAAGERASQLLAEAGCGPDARSGAGAARAPPPPAARTPRFGIRVVKGYAATSGDALNGHDELSDGQCLAHSKFRAASRLLRTRACAQQQEVCKPARLTIIPGCSCWGRQAHILTRKSMPNLTCCQLGTRCPHSAG